jgi:hypothetical protein
VPKLIEDAKLVCAEQRIEMLYDARSGFARHRAMLLVWIIEVDASWFALSGGDLSSGC